MFSFAHPELFLLVFIPLLAKLLPASGKRERTPSYEVYHSQFDRLKEAFNVKAGTVSQFSMLHRFLIWLTWIFLVVALMQPRDVNKFTNVETRGYDIMLAVDLSGSMRSLDFADEEHRLSRLDVIKRVVGQFVMERQGDRVGLVTFGSSAYLQVPLTLDTQSISKILNNMEIGMAGGDATDIGDAIGLAVKTLRLRPEGSRVIILLTDGANNSGSLPPMVAAKLAQKYGIRIYTVGVGTDGVVPYPDQYGRIQMVRFDFDEDALKAIANMTGGAYFRATDQQGLKNIYSRIDKMEKTKVEAKEYMIIDSLYYIPLGFALAFLAAIIVLPIIRRRVYGLN